MRDPNPSSSSTPVKVPIDKQYDPPTFHIPQDVKATSQDNSKVVHVGIVAKICLDDLMRVSAVFFMKRPFP